MNIVTIENYIKARPNENMMSTELSKINEISVPREKSTAIASILSASTSLAVCLPVGLNCVPLPATIALMLLLTMFSRVVLLDSC